MYPGSQTFIYKFQMWTVAALRRAATGDTMIDTQVCTLQWCQICESKILIMTFTPPILK